MKKNNKDIDKIKINIIDSLKKNKIARAEIFWGYARCDQKKSSDIDILIKVKNDKFSLLDLVRRETMWNIIKEDLPILRKEIEPILNKGRIKCQERIR